MAHTRRDLMLGAAAMLGGCASVPPAPRGVLEIVEQGFEMTEGPVWSPSGTLLFTELRRSEVREIAPGAAQSRLLRSDDAQANGLAFAADGSLYLCEMRGRRVSRCAAPWSGAAATVVDRFEGRRLNSPNDLVFDKAGGFYFTDPPFGLEGGDEDPAKELAFNGVFYVAPGSSEPRLVHREMLRPNGLALIDGGTRLIVSNSHPSGRVWMAIELKGAGEAGRVSELARLPDDEPRGAPDGFAPGPDGHLYASGSDAIWRITREGAMSVVVRLPDDRPSNCGFGGPDGDVLFITGRKAVYSFRL